MNLPVPTQSIVDDGSQEANKTSTSRQKFAFGVASPIIRQEQLLLSEYMSDVVFQVGNPGKLIHAHKLILTVASAVFHAQFNGSFDEANRDTCKSPIVVDDIEPEIFVQVLRYIYCQKVDLTAENVTDIYCVADRYFLTGLKTECEGFFQRRLHVKNVLKVLNRNQQYGFENVNKFCLTVIQDNPIPCLQHNDFLTLCRPALELIANCQSMNCQKDQLHSAIEKWCKANDPNADIIPQLETLQCEKLFSFSNFCYGADVSTDLTFTVKGTMYLYGLGIFIGKQPETVSPTQIKLTIKIDPGSVLVYRTACIRRNLYIEKVMFEKVTVTNQCRIIVSFPQMDLFCLEGFKPVVTLGALDLTVTDTAANSSQQQQYGYNTGYNYHHQPRSQPRLRNNCLAYLLYRLD